MNKKSAEIELHPDGWQRFERAMAVVVKAPPQHKSGKSAPKRKRRKTTASRK